MVKADRPGRGVYAGLKLPPAKLAPYCGLPHYARPLRIGAALVINRIAPGIALPYYLFLRTRQRPSATAARSPGRPPISIPGAQLQALEPRWSDWALRVLQQSPDDPTRAVALLHRMLKVKLSWTDALLADYRLDWPRLFWRMTRTLERTLDRLGSNCLPREPGPAEVTIYFHPADTGAVLHARPACVAGMHFLRAPRRYILLLRRLTD